jgi:hypothetical protein
MRADRKAATDQVALVLRLNVMMDCRELYADMLGYLGLPAGMGQPHLAYLFKATVEAFSARGS